MLIRHERQSFALSLPSFPPVFQYGFTGVLDRAADRHCRAALNRVAVSVEDDKLVVFDRALITVEQEYVICPFALHRNNHAGALLAEGFDDLGSLRSGAFSIPGFAFRDKDAGFFAVLRLRAQQAASHR